MLVLEPDHPEARRALRYSRHSGGWRRSSAYRTPKNRSRDPERLVAAQARFAGAFGDHRERVLALLEEVGERLPQHQAQAALERLLELDADDTSIRARLGEALVDGRWLLVESERALTQQPRVRRLAREALEGAPEPTRLDPANAPVKGGLVWRSAFGNEHARLFGTVPVPELERSARDVDAAYAFLLELGSGPVAPRPNLTFYALRDSRERDQLLPQFSALPDAQREALGRAEGGWFVAREQVGQWSRDPERRRDGAVRQAFAVLLHDGFGLTSTHGWAWESLGLYLGYQLIGTRRTFFFSSKGYERGAASPLRKSLQTEPSWRDAALQLHRSGAAPPLRRVVSRTLNDLSDEDALVAYALSAYLVEGTPDAWPSLLRAIGRGDVPASAFERELGWSLEVLERRLWRFLAETHSNH